MSACNNSRPFTYQYTSKDQVVIDYLGKKYFLDQNEKIETPFEYAFEDDGDLDIVLEGRKYEIESPYDIDVKTTKKVKKKSKKISSKKKKR